MHCNYSHWRYLLSLHDLLIRKQTNHQLQWDDKMCSTTLKVRNNQSACKLKIGKLQKAQESGTEFSFTVEWQSIEMEIIIKAFRASFPRNFFLCCSTRALSNDKKCYANILKSLWKTWKFFQEFVYSRDETAQRCLHENDLSCKRRQPIT